MLKMLCIIGDLWLILWPTPLAVALPEVLVLVLSLSLSLLTDIICIWFSTEQTFITLFCKRIFK